MHTPLSLRGQEIILHKVDDLAGCGVGGLVCFLTNISLAWILNIPTGSEGNVNDMSFMVSRCVGGKESPVCKQGSVQTVWWSVLLSAISNT